MLPKSIGMVFDLSLRHDADGRIIDKVKQQVISFLRKDLTEEDSFYLYHPYVLETSFGYGEQVSMVGNYETDGWSFDIQTALKQTLYILGAEDDGCDKYLILVTDKLVDSKIAKKIAFLNQREHIFGKIIFVSLVKQDWEDSDISLCEISADLLASLFEKEVSNGENIHF